MIFAPGEVAKTVLFAPGNSFQLHRDDRYELRLGHPNGPAALAAGTFRSERSLPPYSESSTAIGWYQLAGTWEPSRVDPAEMLAPVSDFGLDAWAAPALAGGLPLRYSAADLGLEPPVAVLRNGRFAGLRVRTPGDSYSSRSQGLPWLDITPARPGYEGKEAGGFSLVRPVTPSPVGFNVAFTAAPAAAAVQLPGHGASANWQSTLRVGVVRPAVEGGPAGQVRVTLPGRPGQSLYEFEMRVVAGVGDDPSPFYNDNAYPITRPGATSAADVAGFGSWTRVLNPARQTAVVVDLPAVADGANEPTEWAWVEVRLPFVYPQGVARAVLPVHDARPVVTAGVPFVREGQYRSYGWDFPDARMHEVLDPSLPEPWLSEPGQVWVSRVGGDLSQPLDAFVAVATGGGAAEPGPGRDFTVAGAERQAAADGYDVYKVSFAAGRAAAVLDLVPEADALSEPLEGAFAWALPFDLAGGMVPYLAGGGLASAGVVSPRLVLTDANGVEVTTSPKVTDPRLKVAKWEKAFEVDPADSKKARLKPPVMDTGSGSKLDFIDHDVDRFNVRVYDPVAYAKNNGPGQVDHLDATVETRNVAGFEAYNDPATTLRLVRTPADSPGPFAGPGWWMSDSQLLVSNKVDDEYHDPAYLGKDETGPAGNKNPKFGMQFPVTDRTHRVALDGTVQAVFTPAGGVPMTADTVVIPQFKPVKVHITIVRDKAQAAGGSGVISESAALNAVNVLANEFYAQVGIRLVAAVQTIDPPTHPTHGPVILNDGVGLDEYKAVGAPTAEEKALLEAKVGMVDVRTAAVDDIELYFVNTLSDGSRGEAFPAAQKAWDRKHVDSAIIAADTYTRSVVAHEIGHILLDDPAHPPSPVNLMRDFNGWPDLDIVEGSRRLTRGQQTRLDGRPRPDLLVPRT